MTTKPRPAPSPAGSLMPRHAHRERHQHAHDERRATRARRARGKSDPIDAYAAARTALSGTHVMVPKAGVGIVEAIRALRVTRRGAVKARTQATNQLKSLMV